MISSLMPHADCKGKHQREEGGNKGGGRAVVNCNWSSKSLLVGLGFPEASIDHPGLWLGILKGRRFVFLLVEFAQLLNCVRF